MAENFGGTCAIVPVNAGRQAGSRRPSGARRAVADHLALGVVGVALLAPAHREAVALAPVHHERDGLGRLAERERQEARGERIERAGVAGALAP